MDGTDVRRGLSATALKYIAAFFMVVDHADAIFHLLGSIWGPGDWRHYLLRCLGRISFPIFLFFVAEGCRKTRSLPRYLRRLALLALVSQAPFLLGVLPWEGSVVLTLFLGALGVYCYTLLQGRLPAAAACLPALGLALLGELLSTDYGWAGVLLVPALYLCGARRGRALAVLTAGMALQYLVLYPCRAIVENWLPPGVGFWQGLPQILPGFLSMWLPHYLLYMLFAGVAVFLLSRYSGGRDRGGKWFFYWFYPAHLLALWGLSMLVFH